MKKPIIMFAFVGCAVLFSAAPTRAEVINVVTTTTDLKSVVEYIGGDRVNAYSLGKGNQNYHFLQAKPSYMIKAKKADLFIRIGLDFEIGYEPLILEGSRNRKIQVGRDGHLDASVGIKPLDVHQHVDRSMGDIHGQGNPHYWLDPLNMKIVATHMADRLSQISPQDQSLFDRNLSQFNALIDEKMLEWGQMLSPYAGEKLITYHKSLVYFADRFGFEIIGELEPKPGVPPSPMHLKHIINLVKQEGVKIILLENVYKDNAAKYVAGKTQAQVVVTPISVGGAKEANDYFELMDTIVNQLKVGFRDD